MESSAFFKGLFNNKLPFIVKEAFIALMREIESSGPVRGNWKNDAKLGALIHHCHLKPGKSTYLAC